jgi:proline iminopeptidase
LQVLIYKSVYVPLDLYEGAQLNFVIQSVLFMTFFLFANLGFAKVKENEGHVQVKGGKIWYKVFSDIKTAHNTPLIILHGGPGAPHNYLLPLKKLAEQQPVVFYDQLGCGNSKDFDSNDSDLWTIPRFTDELHKLVKHLGYKHVSLLGHSWGTTLAFEYYRLHPNRVEKMIFEGSFFSNTAWMRDANFLRDLLPDETKAILSKYEKSGDLENVEYQDAVTVYYKRHLNRQDPWPQDLLDTFANLGEEVYLAMNGPNEFSSTGSLKNYEVVSELKQIKVPTLFVSGQYDEVQPGTTWEYASKVKNSQIKIFPKSSHTPHLEETEAFLQTVADFLN